MIGRSLHLFWRFDAEQPYRGDEMKFNKSAELKQEEDWAAKQAQRLLRTAKTSRTAIPKVLGRLAVDTAGQED
jgi:hypothetical protein